MLSGYRDIIRKDSAADYVHIVDEETANNAARSIFNAIKFETTTNQSSSTAANIDCLKKVNHMKSKEEENQNITLNSTNQKPENGDIQPTKPENRNIQPTKPENGDIQPTKPENRNIQPTKPENGDIQLTKPENGNSRPPKRKIEVAIKPEEVKKPRTDLPLIPAEVGDGINFEISNPGSSKEHVTTVLPKRSRTRQSKSNPLENISTTKAKQNRSDDRQAKSETPAKTVNDLSKSSKYLTKSVGKQPKSETYAKALNELSKSPKLLTKSDVKKSVKNETPAKTINELSKGSKLFTISKEGKNRLKRAFQGILAPKNLTIKCQDIGKTLERIPLEEIVDHGVPSRKKFRSTLRCDSVSGLSSKSPVKKDNVDMKKDNVDIETSTPERPLTNKKVPIDPSKLVFDTEKLKKFNSVVSKCKGLKSMTSASSSSNTARGKLFTIATSVSNTGCESNSRNEQHKAENSSSKCDSSHDVPRCKDHAYCNNKRLTSFMKERSTALQELKRLSGDVAQSKRKIMKQPIPKIQSKRDNPVTSNRAVASTHSKSSAASPTTSNTQNYTFHHNGPKQSNSQLVIQRPLAKLTPKLPISRVTTNQLTTVTTQRIASAYNANALNNDMISKMMVVGNSFIFPRPNPTNSLLHPTLGNISTTAQASTGLSSPSNTTVAHPMVTCAPPSSSITNATTILKPGNVIPTLVPLSSNPQLLTKPNTHFYVKSKDGLYIRVANPSFRPNFTQQVLQANQTDSADMSFPRIVSVQSIQKSGAKVRSVPLSIKTHIPTHHTVKNPITAEIRKVDVPTPIQTTSWKSKHQKFDFIPMRNSTRMKCMIGLDFAVTRLLEYNENPALDIT